VSLQVPVAVRFEIKKLLRQRQALMAEGYAECRKMYLNTWKEAEAKAMAVAQVKATHYS
jgi:hypothetical protein